MKHYSQHQIDSLLNQYIDGVLGDAERKEVEDLVASNAEVRKELDQLKRMKGLLSDQRKIEPNVAFWTRLSTHIEEHKDQENLLPFPGKYVPTAALSGILGILLIGFVIFQNRMSLFHFVTEKSQMVQSAYEQAFLKGSILPLLSHVDNNQVLQFSLLGVLPLDAKAETALRVDQDSASGYKIRLGKETPKKSKQITVKDFYSEIQATDQQQKVIDSLVGIARRRIETSVLVSDNQAVAIDPELAQLNRMMVSNIAACLEPVQRVRFGRFLAKRDAPYTFISKQIVPAEPESIYVRMDRMPRRDQFVVFTLDTVAMTHVNAALIREAEHRSEVSARIQGLAKRNLELTEKLLKHYAGRELRSAFSPQLPAPAFEVTGDANTVSIQFNREFNPPGWQSMQPVVVPVPRRTRSYSEHAPSAQFEFGFYGDSVTSDEIAIDSAMVQFFDRKSPERLNLRMIDSIFSSLHAKFLMHPEAFTMDSVMRSLEETRRKAVEAQRQHQLMIQKETRFRKKDPSLNDQ